MKVELKGRGFGDFGFIVWRNPATTVTGGRSTQTRRGYHRPYIQYDRMDTTQHREADRGFTRVSLHCFVCTCRYNAQENTPPATGFQAGLLGNGKNTNAERYVHAKYLMSNFEVTTVVVCAPLRCVGQKTPPEIDPRGSYLACFIR